MDTINMIYVSGYAVSLVFLTVATTIFVSYR